MRAASPGSQRPAGAPPPSVSKRRIQAASRSRRRCIGRRAQQQPRDGARARCRRARRNGADVEEPSAMRQCGPAPWVPTCRPDASNSAASGPRNTQAGPASARLAHVDLHAVGHHLEQRGGAGGRHDGRRPLLRRGRWRRRYGKRAQKRGVNAGTRLGSRHRRAALPAAVLSGSSRRSWGSRLGGVGQRQAAGALAARFLHRGARRQHHQADLVGDGDQLEAHLDHAVGVGRRCRCGGRRRCRASTSRSRSALVDRRGSPAPRGRASAPCRARRPRSEGPT